MQDANAFQARKIYCVETIYGAQVYGSHMDNVKWKFIANTVFICHFRWMLVWL